MFWGVRTASLCGLCFFALSALSAETSPVRLLIKGQPQDDRFILPRLERLTLHRVPDEWREVTLGRFVVSTTGDRKKQLRRDLGTFINPEDFVDIDEALLTYFGLAPSQRAFEAFTEAGIQYLHANFLYPTKHPEPRMVRRWAGVLYLFWMLENEVGIAADAIDVRLGQALDKRKDDPNSGKEKTRSALEDAARDLVLLAYSEGLELSEDRRNELKEMSRRLLTISRISHLQLEANLTRALKGMDCANLADFNNP